MLKRSSQPPLDTGGAWMGTGAAFGAGTLTRAARAKPATSETANRRLVGEIKRGLASAAKTCLWRTWGIQRTAWLRSCARRDRVAAVGRPPSYLGVTPHPAAAPSPACGGYFPINGAEPTSPHGGEVNHLRPTPRLCRRPPASSSQ